MKPKSKLRILISDDHALVRDGIRARLEDQAGIVVAGEAKDGAEVVELTEALKPDLLMLDINMPNLSGFDAVEAIQARNLQCNILMLTLHDNTEYVRRALALGTNGYILKDISQKEMISAIRVAAEGGFYLSEKLAKLMDRENEKTELYSLTDRETQVLVAIAEGKLNKQIAADLNISIRTVESHRSALRQKTGGGNAAMLAKIAADLGLV